MRERTLCRSRSGGRQRGEVDTMFVVGIEPVVIRLTAMMSAREVSRPRAAVMGTVKHEG
jgi:hypothetical protein